MPFGPFSMQFHHLYFSFSQKKNKIILITVIEPVMYMAYSGVPDSPIICLHALLEEFAQCVIKHSVWHLINQRD